MGRGWSQLTVYQQMLPGGTTHWSVDEMPDQAGKTILITGANTGIGLECARVLLRRNAKVYITSRDTEKGARALEDLREVSTDVHLIHLDLADLRSVKAAADEFKSKETSLDILMCNAGIMTPPVEETTAQEYDLQFGVNVLGHYYLTQLLLPLLLDTSKQKGKPVRVVNMSSATAYMVMKTGGIEYSTLVDGPTRRKWESLELYKQSKAAMSIYSLEMARRYREQGIVTICLNPGNIKTALVRNWRGLQSWIVDNLLMWDLAHGVITPLFAATAPRAEELNGKFLLPWARVSDHRKDFKKPELGERLWTFMQSEIEKFEKSTAPA